MAQTPSPTTSDLLVAGPLIPTETLVPMNVSDCSNIDPNEEWPFPTDCLQLVWMEHCTERGLGYPADVSNMTNTYNSIINLGGYETGQVFGSWRNYTEYVEQLGTRSADPATYPEEYETCRGSSLMPTVIPTPFPTTAPPSPVPTRIPTYLTPAPTYAEESLWIPFYPEAGSAVAANNDGTTQITKHDLKVLCNKNFNRQYDDTEYIFRVRVQRDFDTGIYGNWTEWDYWRPEDGVELCDAMVFRDEDYNQVWPMRCKNELEDCFVTSSDYWDGTIPMNDGRSYPHLWVGDWDDPNAHADSDPTQTGAYSGVNDDTPEWGHPVEIQVASRRVFRACQKRVSPYELVDEDNTMFSWTVVSDEGRLVENPCYDGTDRQPMAKFEIIHPYGSSLLYDSQTKLVSCDVGHDQSPAQGDNDVFMDDWALWYAIKNLAFQHCSVECIFDIRPLKDNQLYPNFWEWTPNGPPGVPDSIGTTAGCWTYGVEDGHPDRGTELDKYLSNPTGGACRVSQNTATPALEAQWENKATYVYWQTQMAEFCTEECNYAENWFLNEADETCIRKIPEIQPATAYSPLTNLMTQTEAEAECTRLNATLVSVTAWEENKVIQDLCHRDISNQDWPDTMPRNCWIGYPTPKGSFNATWPDGSAVEWTHFETTEWAAGGNDTNATTMYMDQFGYWNYYDPARDEETATANTYEGICEYDADLDQYRRLKNFAEDCRDAEAWNYATNDPVTPVVIIDDCGFTDPLNPHMLHIVIEIPRRLYDMQITFENSTNDHGEWNLMIDPEDTNLMWTMTNYSDGCDGVYRLESEIPWTVFNLGGAGGVTRLENYRIPGALIDTYELINENAIDQMNKWYIFATTVRVSGKFPIRTQVSEVDHILGTDIYRSRYDVTDIIIRTPLIIKFQKSVVVESEFEIVSTKFNYKTVAAIIESIQLDTRYDEPPYARFELKIRTKSQYPYMFDECQNANATDGNPYEPDIAYDGQRMFECTDYHYTFPEPTETERGPITNTQPIDSQVTMQLYWVSSDLACTFVNPDHSREGDVCTQEWRLRLMPERNKCYATGDYHIRYDTRCFHEKEVCYMPKDSDGNYINVVEFNFKIQTSQFCPQVVDEVQLTGFMQCTGRESYKPEEENAALEQVAAAYRVEGNTPGSSYLQGEVVKFLAYVESPKARITETRVRMVEVTQDLTTLLQTGVNRIPYDVNQGHMVIWTRPVEQDDGSYTQLATGIFSLVYQPGNVRVDDIFVMGGEDDGDVMKSGDLINADETNHDIVFLPTECGFQMLLHSKAFPINRQSFGVKTVIVTMEVDYQALDVVLDAGRRRRRLLTAEQAAYPGTDSLTALSPVRVQAFAATIDNYCSQAECGVKLVATMPDSLHSDPNLFVANLEYTIRTSLEAELYPASEIHADQVKVTIMEIYDKKTNQAERFWSASGYVDIARRPNYGRRRLPDIPNQQAYNIYISFIDAGDDYPAASALRDEFADQISRPASALMMSDLMLSTLLHTVEHHDPASDIMRDIDVVGARKNSASHISPALPTTIAIVSCICVMFFGSGLW